MKSTFQPDSFAARSFGAEALAGTLRLRVTIHAAGRAGGAQRLPARSRLLQTRYVEAAPPPPVDWPPRLVAGRPEIRPPAPPSRILFRRPDAPAPAVNRHAGALQVFAAGVEVKHLVAVGTLPGVTITRVAGRNGPGMGYLRSSGPQAGQFAWSAPGSSSFGAAAAVDATGEALLRDGDDPDKFVVVHAHAGFLGVEPSTARVMLRDVYDNAVAHDDLSAGEAAAGDVDEYQLTLRNVSDARLENLRCWIDAATEDLKISDDGLVWHDPTDEADALWLGDLAGGAETTLHVQRTIGAAADADAGVLNHLHLAFSGLF